MSTPVRRVLSALALSALAIGTLSACAADEPAEFDTPDTSTQDQTSTAAEQPTGGETTAAGTSGEEDDGAGPIAVEHPDAEDAFATFTYDVQRPADASVTVAVHPLRVDGPVMILQLSFTPDFRGDDPQSVFQMNDWRAFSPVLNDRENLTQYSIIKDGATTLATDINGPRAASGQTLTYWAYYPAPEDDIDSIVVSLDHVEFENVPIERP